MTRGGVQTRVVSFYRQYSEAIEGGNYFIEPTGVFFSL